MNNDNKVETAIAGLNRWASYATVCNIVLTWIPFLPASLNPYRNPKRPEAKSRYYKERQVDRKKRKAIRWWFVSIRHGRHVLSQCPKQRHSPPGNIKNSLFIVSTLCQKWHLILNRISSTLVLTFVKSLPQP